MTDIDKIPVISETASISTRLVSDGKVRVTTQTELTQETVYAGLESEKVDVVRVPFDREVTEMPGPRVEGVTTIIPVYEERLVVEKRVFLVEEIHLTKIRSSQKVEIPVQLRHQKAAVERTPTPTETEKTP
ncbi:YsnF/AvaK domain-containing protein (plasmid) [Rhizobium sp. TH2]|uniref:YsnF/AvaK domain-containing protein n=1 Tax=Rhizobium sp. TH2 TaxID=2775403 RepID=UPI0021585588|nr:YsnF/AvaK domain-containing protein [Rhizobium sp. TH2]UVC12619.1 YsnF/AvaK domain-containing protein [Rhizobium sp. TH2]